MNLVGWQYENSFLKKNTNAPIMLAVFCYLVVTSFYIYQLICKTGGHFIYPLDDTYISLAVARNVIERGVWGVDKYGFSSVTSSLLWPLLLALASIVPSIRQFSPLILNVIFSLISLFFVSRIVKRAGLSPLMQIISLLAFVLLIPLPVMTSLGMETTMQICFTVLFIDLAASALSLPAPTLNWQLCASAIMLGASRYEGLFTIAIVSMLLAIKKRYWLGFLLLACGCLPIVIFGIYSVMNGSYFIPNSVLFKAHYAFLPINPSKGYFHEAFLNWFDTLGVQIFYEPVGIGLLLLSVSLTSQLSDLSLLQKKVASVCMMLTLTDAAFAGIFLALGHNMSAEMAYQLLFTGMRITAFIALLNGLLLFWWLYTSRVWTTARIWLIIFVLNFMLHMLLARVGWGYRYEAYLVAQGILVLTLFWQELYFGNNTNEKSELYSKKNNIKLVNSGCILGIILLELSARAIISFPGCMALAVSVYRQQYQMAKFIQQYFPDSTVLIGDIGAIAFYNEHIKIIDLVGLANINVLKARLSNKYNSAFASQLANSNHCDLIVIYDYLLTRGFDGIPSAWTKIGTWTDKDNKGGDITVTFYVLKAKTAHYASECLQQFQLPPEVQKTVCQLAN